MTTKKKITEEPHVDDVMLRTLQTEFTTAITCQRGTVTLDTSIAKIREKLAQPEFIEPFSIYSRSQIRKMDNSLAHIRIARLIDNPAEVADAVRCVLQLFRDLEVSVKRTAASKAWINAHRCSD